MIRIGFVAILAFTGLTLTGLASGARATCPGPVSGAVMVPVEPAPYAVALAFRPSQIKVGEPFAVELRVCASNGSPIDRVTVDAVMPAHRHGMNYTPDVASLGDGRYDAKGLLFHMPGLWRLTASVYAAGQPARLTYEVEIR